MKNFKIKLSILIPIIIILGIFSLLLFPNPENNFFLYVLTGLFFVVLVVVLLRTIIFK
ncbi:hypothetical protein HOD75_00250 [archaeon]|nr:hypothetical protein [archaeon]MBT4241308.1 hypothetical protein [archaeon]